LFGEWCHQDLIFLPRNLRYIIPHCFSSMVKEFNSLWKLRRWIPMNFHYGQKILKEKKKCGLRNRLAIDFLLG
jgi:hypothetical protein